MFYCIGLSFFVNVCFLAMTELSPYHTSCFNTHVFFVVFGYFLVECVYAITSVLVSQNIFQTTIISGTKNLVVAIFFLIQTFVCPNTLYIFNQIKNTNVFSFYTPAERLDDQLPLFSGFFISIFISLRQSVFSKFTVSIFTFLPRSVFSEFFYFYFHFSKSIRVFGVFCFYVAYAGCVAFRLVVLDVAVLIEVDLSY